METPVRDSALRPGWRVNERSRRSSVTIPRHFPLTFDLYAPHHSL
uniref:Uncharacterized protein n=1 Tax=Anguilla anguilla TaxID=7936 RepID=A0A0E9QV72_ANGAN